MSLEKTHYMHVALFEWQPDGTEAAELWYDSSCETLETEKWKLERISPQGLFSNQTLTSSEILTD